MRGAARAVPAPTTTGYPGTPLAKKLGIRATLLRDTLNAMRPDAIVWVSWPKRAAAVPTDITEDVIRELALPMNLVDI